MSTPLEQLNVPDFAKRVREKYAGAYDDVPDDVLVDRVVSKYPDYKSSVKLPDFDAPITNKWGAPRSYGGHTGVDIGYGKGERVGVPLPGRVTFAGERSGYGNRIEVDHGNGVVTTYSHLDGFDVKTGDEITPDRPLGRVGNTGGDYHPHLHFEVLRDGQKVNAADTPFRPRRLSPAEATLSAPQPTPAAPQVAQPASTLPPPQVARPRRESVTSSADTDVRLEEPQTAAEIPFAPYRAEEKSHLGRAAYGLGAMTRTFDNPPNVANPDDAGKAVQLRVPVKDGNPPSNYEVSLEVARQISPEMAKAVESYKAETGRDLLQIGREAFEGRLIRDPKGDYYDVVVSPTRADIEVANAYNKGGLQAAQEAAARIGEQRKTYADAYNSTLAQRKAHVTGQGPVERAVVAGEGMIEDTAAGYLHTAANVSALASAMYTGLRHGWDSPEYQKLNLSEQDTRKALEAAQGLLQAEAKEQGSAARIVRGIGSGVAQLPKYMAAGPYGAGAVAAIESADKGPKAMVEEGVKMNVLSAIGELAGGLKNPVARQVAGRAAGGAFNVGAAALQGETDPRVLAEQFGIGAAISGPGKSHERTGEVAPRIAPTERTARRSALDIDVDVPVRTLEAPRVVKGMPEAAPAVEALSRPTPAQEATPTEAVETPLRQRFQHRDFGLVEVADSQSGVPQGKVRVVSTVDGSEHVIQKANGRGQGNSLAVPVREAQRAEGQNVTEGLGEIPAPQVNERTTQLGDSPRSTETLPVGNRRGDTEAGSRGVAQVEAAAAPDRLTAPVPDARTFREQMKSKFQLSDEQADAVTAIADARARAWAKENGKDASDYYAARFAGVVRGGEASPEALHQVIGHEGASRLEDATKRVDNLNVAREMEKAGKDAKAIWLATGWEKGGDGKWKTEIDDTPAVTRNMLAAMKKVSGVPMPFEYDTVSYRKTGEGTYDVTLRRKNAQTVTKDFYRLKDVTLYDIGEVSPVVEQIIRERRGKDEQTLDDNFEHEITERVANESGKIINNGVYLGSLINHPELFRAYPELRDVPVVFDSEMSPYGGTKGSTSDTAGGMPLIRLSPYMKLDAVRSTLKHEIQHVIQRIEGFARGGSPDAFVPELKRERSDIADRINDINARLYKTEGEEYQRLLNERDELRKQYQEYEGEHGLGVHDKANDRYRRLGGEVEARNVQSRLELSPEERAAKSLSETEDVHRDSQIYLQKALGEAREQINRQGNKAAVEFMQDGRAVIRAFKQADVSSAWHEMAHVFRRDLPENLRRDAEDALSVKDGKWAREHDERFARGFERYLKTGEAPTVKLRRVFEAAKQWLTEIYGAVRGKNHPLTFKPNEQLTAVFDRMLGGEPKGEYGQLIHQLHKAPDEGTPAFFENAQVKRALRLKPDASATDVRWALAEAVGQPRSSHLTPGDVTRWADSKGLNESARKALDFAVGKYKESVAKPTEYEQTGIRKSRYDAATDSLSQAVRAMGGLRITADNRGEMRRLHETTSGLTRRNGGLGADEMITRLKEDGYFAKDEDVSIADFLSILEADAAGTQKHYSSQKEYDFEEMYRQQNPEDSADALISLIETERGGILFDKVSDGTASRRETEEFKRLAADGGVFPEHAASIIREGQRTKATPVQDSLRGEAARDNRSLRQDSDVSFNPAEFESSADILFQSDHTQAARRQKAYRALLREKQPDLFDEMGRPVRSGRTRGAKRSSDPNQPALSPDLEPQLRKPTAFEQVTDLANAPRALKSSIDLSAAGRQGQKFVTSHPVKALRIFFGDQMRALSNKGYEGFVSDLKANPRFKQMQDAGLYLGSAVDRTELTNREEAFASKFAERVPLVRRSEHAYLAFLDSARSEWFTQLASLAEAKATEAQKPVTAEQYKALADFVNKATGRGDLGEGNVKKAAPVLNALLFSPRYMASKVQFFDPRVYARLPEGARGTAIRQAVTHYAVLATTLALAKAGQNYIGWQVKTDDPTSADFGKVKVGNTRYDIAAGDLSYVTLAARLFRHFEGGGKKDETALKMIDRWLRYKYAPLPAAVRNLDEGKDAVGQPTSLSKEAIQLVAPMYLKDLYDAWAVEGGKGLAKTAPGFVGLGVQTYSERPSLNRPGGPKVPAPSLPKPRVRL